MNIAEAGSIKEAARQHVKGLVEPINALVGQVIAKGMLGVLEQCIEMQLLINEYELVLAEQRGLVRKLDVLLNGEDGAAKQPSLCDIVSQIESEGIVSSRRALEGGHRE